MTPEEAKAAVPALEAIANGVSTDASELPEIVTNRRPLRDVTADGLAALEAANRPPVLFVRSGAPARVRRDEDARPLVEKVHEAGMRGALARAANFATISDRGSSHVPPPLDVVRDLLALPDWPFPALRGVTEAPVLRPDGTILDRPGYDQPTGLLYVPPPGAAGVRVPTSPTPAERTAARELLEEALEGFPFADGASRAGALALLLTPVVRPAIDGQVPLALVDAPKAGTGKGLLLSVAALVATGRPAAMLAAPTKEEEWAKVLLSVLMAGASFVVLDEAGELRSPSLAATLTADIFEGRILGRSENVTLPQRATWAAAGNNIRLGGDLARRCYWIRLDAKTARPWQRAGFRHADLLAWAAGCRADLLGALLTLARSWYAEGRPPARETPTLGGFNPWARTIAGILAHAGVPDFLGNLEHLYDQADEEAAAWEAFLRTWRTLHGEAPVTVAQLADQAGRDGELRDTLPDDLAVALEKSQASFKAKLGRALGKRTGTRYGDDGLRIERAGQDSRSSVTSWQVVAEVQRSQRSLSHACGEKSTRESGHHTSANSATSAEEEAW